MSEPFLLFAMGVWAVTVAWRTDARRLRLPGSGFLLASIAALATADVVSQLAVGAAPRVQAAAAVCVVIANGILLWTVHEIMRPSPARTRAHMFDALVLGSAAVVVLLPPLGAR